MNLDQIELERLEKAISLMEEIVFDNHLGVVAWGVIKSHLRQLREKGGDVQMRIPGKGDSSLTSPEHSNESVGAKLDKMTTKHLQSCIHDCQNSRVKDQLAVIVGNATVGKVCDMAQLWLNSRDQLQQPNEDTERLDWLVSHSFEKSNDSLQFHWTSPWSRDLREAIDKARRK